MLTGKTIHHADLQTILRNEVCDTGAIVRTNCEVVSVNCEAADVRLLSGEVVLGDLVVAADGFWSSLRNTVVEEDVSHVETGDLAYRGTFTREQLEALGDADLKAFCRSQQLTCGSDHSTTRFSISFEEANLIILFS
jgi:salicylate hydroxylase